MVAPAVWTVTLELEGGTYADHDLVYSIPDKGTLTLDGHPVKTDCKYDGWETRVYDKEGKTYEATPFYLDPAPDGEEPTKVTADTTIYAKWKTFAYKAEGATDPDGSDKDKYFDNFAQAKAAGVDSLVVLKDVVGNRLIDVTAFKSIDLNGYTFTFNSNDYGFTTTKNTVIKNGTVLGGTHSGISITSGTFENVTLSNIPEGGISGGFFSFAGDEAAVKNAVATLNGDNSTYGTGTKSVVEGKKLYLSNGYYKPVAYKTLTIDADTTVGWALTNVDVFEGEVTKIPEAIQSKIDASQNKLDKWLIVKVGGDPEEFVFGDELTKDTAIFATWSTPVTVTYSVDLVENDGPYDPYEWTVDYYSDEVLVAPVEPTEEEYANMPTEGQEKAAREAWAIIKGEGFLGWRYSGTQKDVIFGTETAGDCEEIATNNTIVATTKNRVNFCDVTGKVFETIWVNDGESVGDRLPEAPEVPGRTFLKWRQENTENAPLYDETEKLYGSVTKWAYATYSSGDWSISSVDSDLSKGNSALPTDSLTFGGDEELSLIIGVPGSKFAGKYFLGFVIEAPDSVVNADNHINEQKWCYKSDDENTWKNFNFTDGMTAPKYDEINGSGHLVLRMYKEVTKDMLKELADTANHIKTYTITFAPADKLTDTSSYVTLTVKLDPKNVYMYNRSATGPYTVNELPEFGIKDYQYKWTISFNMGEGAKEIEPIELEYGDNFAEKLHAWGTAAESLVKFADSSLNGKTYDQYKGLVKKYATLIDLGYNEDEWDTGSNLKATNAFNGEGQHTYIVRGDATFFAMYNSVPVTVHYWALNDGEFVEQEDISKIGLSDALSSLRIPPEIQKKFGTEDWHPAQAALADNVWTINKDKISVNIYDITSSDLVADVYLDGETSNKYIVTDAIGGYHLHLVRGEKASYEVRFLSGTSKDSQAMNGSKSYMLDDEGVLTFGQIEVPEIPSTATYRFNGWLLIDQDHTVSSNEPQVQVEYDFKNLQELRVFNFETNADKSVADSRILWNNPVDKDGKVLLFVPSVTDLRNGCALLTGKNVFFDGMIQMMVRYQFQNSDQDSWDSQFVVFRTGDTVLAKVALKDYNTEYSADGQFVYFCPVPIVNYTDTVNIRVEDAQGKEWNTYDGTNNYKLIIGGYDYSLKTYAENKESSSNPKMAALALAVEDYGIATRIFAKKTDVDPSMLSERVTKMTVDQMTGVVETVVGGDTLEGVKFNQRVIFDSDNTLEVQITLGSGTYTIKQDGNVLDIAPVDGKVLLSVPNIDPLNLNTAHVFEVTDENGNTATYTTSALGYAKSRAAKGSTDMQNLAKALYNYSKAAEAYAG